MAALRQQQRELVGRERDLLLITEALAQIRTGSSAVIVTGDAGIGKTAVWTRSLVVAEDLGLRVLSARSSETESTFAFAGLIDLLADITDETLLTSLPAPQADALRAALLRGERELVPSANVVAVATLSALRSLSSDTPVVLAIDDVQWLDGPTASVLAYALRRLSEEPVCLVATLRSGEDVAGPLGSLLHERVDAWLDLSPLPPTAVATLLRSQLGSTFVHAQLERVIEASGGNPYFALELASSLERCDEDHTGMLSVPRSLQSLVEARLKNLSESVQEAVLATFALSRPTSDIVRLALRAARRPLRGLDDAIASDVLALESGNVRLRHPLVGSVLYGQLSSRRRRALHARLADLPLNQEERVRHLALATPHHSEKVAEELEAAAARARSRGSPSGAAELLELALRLTPPDRDEAAIRRTYALAMDEYQSGNANRARERWSRLAEELPPGRMRAEALWHLAQFLAAGSAEEMVRFLEEALAEAGDDLDLLARIHTTMARTAWWAGRPRQGAAHAATAIELAERSGSPAVLAGALAQAVTIAVLLGEGLREDLLERAIELERAHGARLPLEALATLARPINMEVLGDDLDRVHDEYVAARTLAEQRGDEPALAYVAISLGELECKRGNWTAAARHVHEAVELIEQVGAIQLRGRALYSLALLDALEGRTEQARERALDALAYDEPRGLQPLIARDRLVLGLLEMSLDRHEAALSWLTPIDRVLREGGYREPAVFRHLPDQIEALVELGRVDEARALLDPWEHDVRKIGRRSALAGSLRGRALVLAAETSLEEAADAAQASSDLFRELGRPFEEGRSLLVLGAIERRRRKAVAAAAAFDRARSIFEQLGARLWAEKARAVVRVRVLGGFEVVEGNHRFEIPAGKPAQLVKLLACSGGRLHAEEAIESLWPETEPSAGRKALRNALARLRSAGAELVTRSDQALLLTPGTHVDAFEFESAARAARAAGQTSIGAIHARDALALYGGDLLPDDPYEPWTAGPRERLRLHRLALIDLLAGEAESRQDGDETLRYLELGIETDPLGEERYLRAAKLNLAMGRRLRAAGALRRGEQVFERVGLPLPEEYRRLARALLPESDP